VNALSTRRRLRNVASPENGEFLTDCSSTPDRADISYPRNRREINSGWGSGLSPKVAKKEMRKGALCIPFDSESKRLADLEKWVKGAARRAGIDLTAIRAEYNSDRTVIEFIYNEIGAADIVVVVAIDDNPNVFFEAGYAQGVGKPILYIVDEGQTAPFDISALEHFTLPKFPTDGRELTEAMTACLRNAEPRASLARGFAEVRTRLLALEPKTRLFGRVMAHALEVEGDWLRGWSDAYLDISGADNVFEMGKFILDNLEEWGFATAYYSGDDSWRFADGGESYFAATRDAVRRGRPVTRTYVVDSLDQLDEPAFRDRAWADASAGLNICYILDTDLPSKHARDFGLWDNALLGEVEYVTDSGGTPRVHQCTYWADDRHLVRARRWRATIERQARPCPDLPSEAKLLDESKKAVTTLCHDNKYEGKRDCTAYHQPWQQLRQLNLVSTPRWHADFYSRAFREWSAWVRENAPDRKLDILITGLADYGMLYWVAQSVPHHVRERCRFHVLDICPTPIESCQWLRRRLAKCKPALEIDLVPHHRNVFDSGIGDGAIDLITADAFLTRFATAGEKKDLMAHWLRMLRPDGRLVTTARVQHHKADIAKADRRDFVTRASAAAGDAPESADELRDAASRYAAYITSYPYASDEDLSNFLDETVISPYVYRTDTVELDHHEMAPGTYANIQVVGEG
jgi:hypothetical protein